MAKIINGNVYLDPNDQLEFKDISDQSHFIYWDDNNNRFVIDGDVIATDYVGATKAILSATNPQPSDDTHEVPTLWVNTGSLKSYILLDVSPGNAIWQLLSDGGVDLITNRITINDGNTDPTNIDSYDMWIVLETGLT